MNQARRDEIRAGDVFSREELMELLVAEENAAKWREMWMGGPHKDIDECPTYYDGCNCGGTLAEENGQWRHRWAMASAALDEAGIPACVERGVVRDIHERIAALAKERDEARAEVDRVSGLWGAKVAELEVEKRKSILDSLTADGQWMDETKKLRDEAEGLKNELAKAREDFESVALAVGVYDYAEGLGYKFGTGDEVVRAIETAMVGEREAQEECDNMAAACRLRQLAYDSMAEKASRLRNRIKQLEHEVLSTRRELQDETDVRRNAEAWWSNWRESCRAECRVSAKLRDRLELVERTSRAQKDRIVEHCANLESAYIERDADRLKTIEALKARLSRVSAIAEEPATTATMPCDPVYVGKGVDGLGSADDAIDRPRPELREGGEHSVDDAVGGHSAFALALDWARAMGEPPEKSLPAWCGIPMISDETVPQDEVHLRQDGRTVQVFKFKRRETT